MDKDLFWGNDGSWSERVGKGGNDEFLKRKIMKGKRAIECMISKRFNGDLEFEGREIFFKDS